jgi:hypothetical protein
MPAALTDPHRAKKRVRRTRSRAKNDLPALAVSTMAPIDYDLTPTYITLVCPSCRTWVPVNQPDSNPRLVQHHTTRAGTANPKRCRDGSYRKIVLDVDPQDWWEARDRHFSQALGTVASRRSNTVHRRPKPPVAPAIARVGQDPRPLTADSVYDCYLSHRANCAVCNGTADPKWKRECHDGTYLRTIYCRLLRRAPQHRRNRELVAAVQVESEPRERRKAARHRANGWRQVGPAVERADTQRGVVPEGTRVAQDHFDVPTRPIRISTPAASHQGN